MKILIDTHVFLWAIGEPSRLGAGRIERLESPRNDVYVSAVTVAELAIKRSIGKIAFDFDPIEIAQRTGFELLDFSARDARALAALPLHHRDPFDRMLVVQALGGDFSLMTDDPQLARYGCRVI